MCRGAWVRNGAARVARVAVLCAFVSASALAAEWEVTQLDDLVIASTTGEITGGDRQWFIFRTGDCDRVGQVFTAYTTQPANFEELDGRMLTVELNGKPAEATLIHSYPFLLGHLLMFSLGKFEKAAILRRVEATEVISIRFVDGGGLKAADYFDVPYNEWRTAGAAEAFDRAYAQCRSQRRG